MGMSVEVLAPGAENGKEAVLSAEVVGGGRDPAQCLGYGAEQNVVETRLFCRTIDAEVLPLLRR
jgi:hypothetical protein